MFFREQFGDVALREAGFPVWQQHIGMRRVVPNHFSAHPAWRDDVRLTIRLMIHGNNGLDIRRPIFRDRSTQSDRLGADSDPAHIRVDMNTCDDLS